MFIFIQLLYVNIVRRSLSSRAVFRIIFNLLHFIYFHIFYYTSRTSYLLFLYLLLKVIIMYYLRLRVDCYETWPLRQNRDDRELSEYSRFGRFAVYGLLGADGQGLANHTAATHNSLGSTSNIVIITIKTEIIKKKRIYFIHPQRSRGYNRKEI